MADKSRIKGARTTTHKQVDALVAKFGTQKAVADAAGVHPGTISTLARGYWPNATTVQKVEELYAREFGKHAEPAPVVAEGPVVVEKVTPTPTPARDALERVRGIGSNLRECLEMMEGEARALDEAVEGLKPLLRNAVDPVAADVVALLTGLRREIEKLDI